MPNSVPFLLVYVGVLTGLNFPLGKLAGAAGVPPALWALLISLGASLTLLPGLLARRALIVPRGAALRYVVLAGLITFVGANLLVFAAIPHVGAGQVGMMFALSPVFTLGLSLVFGLRAPRVLGLIGIALGMGGAMLVALGRGEVAGLSPWALAAVAIPVILAVGNVYRTLDWPEGAEPMALAFWSHLAAALTFVALLLATHGGIPLQAVAEIPSVALAQMAVAGVTFPAFFRLQRLGGPVMLSQIGYVAAATGMAAAVLLLGERYGAMTWAGAGLIALGVGFTLRDQRAPAKARLAKAGPCAT
ncbi:DMT family transporter [Marinovum sp.]|uniref:DMT family transporter n=1 Tax=Marinovum sp. TaxID=2024839 RepID=UPI002B27A6F3|nr:DMT family transporter [Marinovum sp.]